MRIPNLMRYLILFPILFLGGCGDILFSSDFVSTAAPTKEQIEYCRKVMYINPALGIKPLGYASEQGRDIIVSFKFIALTNDSAALFDKSLVDPSKFSTSVEHGVLDDRTPDAWWDLESKPVEGASYRVPHGELLDRRLLHIAYLKNDDGTLTVYAVWHSI